MEHILHRIHYTLIWSVKLPFLFSRGTFFHDRDQQVFFLLHIDVLNAIFYYFNVAILTNPLSNVGISWSADESFTAPQ